MTGNNLALDTNQAIAVLNNTAGAGPWLRGFGAVFLPVPVAGELRFGALNSRRPSENLSRIEGLIRRCQVLPADQKSAVVYAEVRLRLKRGGKPIPENDIWIAALCIQRDLPLATSDEHFDAVKGLRNVRRSFTAIMRLSE